MTADVDLMKGNRINYVGSFNGTSPLETKTPGYIMASMYLIYSRHHEFEGFSFPEGNLLRYETV